MLSDYPNPTNQQIECVDEIITLMLNEATLKVEGQRRSVPRSKKKFQTIETIKCWKNKVK